VPRALWTETMDSPLKRRSVEFDPKEYAGDVLKSQQRQGTMRQYLAQELGRQMRHNASSRQALLDEQRELAQANSTDAQRVMQSQSLERGAVEESRKVVRAALDGQCQEARRREEQNRAREMHEAAEMKLRTVKALCEELDEQGRRRQAAQREAQDSMKQLEAKRRAQEAERRREAQETRRLVQEQALRGEYQLAAQQERLKAAQVRQDEGYRRFSESTARAEEARRQDEEGRLDRGVAVQQSLVDLHYSRRDAARERQRGRMVEALGRQVEAQKRSRSLVDLQKQADLEAVNESAKRSFEQELQRYHGKRRDELQLQRDLVEMMAKKQQHAKSEGCKPAPSAATMQVTPAQLADARTRASSGMEKAASSPDLSQRVDASKYLAKPCGRPEERPQFSVEASEGRQGTGSASGVNGNARAGASAARVQGRVLSQTASLASRDREISVPWHKGLTVADMKTGRQAAAKRGAAAASDKAES